MAEKCVLYYAICVEGNNWSPTGSYSIEPVRVEGKEPLGKKPEWCCGDMERACSFKDHVQVLCPTTQPEPVIVFQHWWSVSANFDYGPVVRFCPFCGAAVVWKHNLDVRVKEEEYQAEPRMVNFYEAVS